MNRYPLTREDRGANLGKLASTLRSLQLDLPKQILAGPVGARGSKSIEAVVEIRDHLEDAAQAVIRGEDPTQHLILHAAWAHRDDLQWRLEDSGILAYIDHVNDSADEVIREIREQVFNPALDELEELYEAHPNALWDEELAASAGDYAQAQRARDAKPTATRLSLAIKARELLHPGAFDDEAAWATEPGALRRGEPEPASVRWWMHLIALGLDLDYPTVGEWEQRRDSEGFRQSEPTIFARSLTEHPELGALDLSK
ncbi:hypothetical protein [Sinomonas gamaensis]|uniref:hypothetical protein n=1 Tax=Sinomonas gamaensis TaxID=2565624 RepID=UPI001107F40C|nr:hypothetical protein [Sinomonas gamaensis]